VRSKEFGRGTGENRAKRGSWFWFGMVSDRNEYNPVNKTGVGGIKEDEVIEAK
jgi:hypothetical protein